MSEENVEIVRGALEAYGRGNVDEMLSYVDSSIEFHSAIIGGTEGNIYQGHEGFRSWLADSSEVFEKLEIDLNDLRDLGDRVIGFGRIRARGRESGLELDSPTGWVFTVRGGKVTKAEGFLNPADAMEAAGLQE
jgi:ketosteroid isomerase-like protein